MTYILIPPCEQLKNIVSSFWLSSWNDSSPYKSNIYYSTADSCAKLVFAFKLRDKQLEIVFASVQGQTQTAEQFPADDFEEILGISFFPYAIPLLFGIPAIELNDQMISLDELIGQQAQLLSQQLASVAAPWERVDILSDFLKHKLLNHNIIDIPIIQAIRHIRQLKGEVNIARFSQEYCLSQKQLERKFLSYCGFTPKLFARIVRFENVLHTYANYSSLTQLAYATGYYDQSHFIHEFKTFSGFAPKDYFSLAPY